MPATPRPTILYHKAFTLTELLVVIALIAVLIGLLVFGISSMRQRSLLIKCASNLRQIGAALQMYDQTHQHLPKVLLPDMLTDMKSSLAGVFSCPAQEITTGAASSYKLNSKLAGKPLGNARPDDILVQESDGTGQPRHGGKRNILYVDGHVDAQDAPKGKKGGKATR